MADVHSKEKRSYNMSMIKGSNTKPEIALRAALWNGGHRYRLKNRDIHGNPDLTFRRAKLAIFVDGCFWHKCPDHFIQPKNNKKFWADKINRNIARDSQVNENLKKEGWIVLRFWEHEIQKDMPRVLKIISSTIKKQ